MSRSVLSGGAIACSAVIVYGWVQAASEAATQPCTAGSDSPTIADLEQADCSRTSTSNQASSNQASSNQAGSNQTGLFNQIPAQLPQLGWSHSSPGKRLGDRPLPADMEATYQRLLIRAQRLASRNQFAQAVAQVNGIPKNSRSFAIARQLQEDWSRELLRQATRHYEQANLTQAIAILATIPVGSSRYPRVVALRQEWTRQAALMQRAIAAKSANRWQEAIDLLQSLQETPLYQSVMVQNLLEQAMSRAYEPDETLLKIAMMGLPSP